MNKEQKSEQGITLIALIVTIIVLLILAGITINLAFNQNGILRRASQAKEMQAIGKLQDQIMIAVARYETDRIAQYPKEKTYEENIAEFKEDLKSQDVIEDVVDVEAPQTFEDIKEDAEVVISTKEGYVFSVTLEKETAKMGDLYYDNQTTAKINVTSTINSITVKVVRPKDKKLTITSIKDITDNGRTIEIPSNAENNKVVISNLPSAHEFEIKMKVEGIKEEITKNISTGELGNINSVKYTIDWSRKTATITIEKDGVGEINWTIGKTGVWNKVDAGKKTFTVPNIEHGMAISFKLTEGTSEKTTGETITITDDVAPKAEITVPEGSYIAGGATKQVEVTVKISDNESGLKLAECKYVVNTESNNYSNSDKSKYTQSLSGVNTTIQVPITTEGKYYVHVMVIDNAGNTFHKVSNPVVVGKDTIKPTCTIEMPSNMPEEGYLKGWEPTQVALIVKQKDDIALDLSKCKYVIDNTSTNYQEDGKYANAISNATQTINIPTSTVGEYYLHILTVDKAGNKTYTVTTKAVKVNGESDWNELAELAKQISNDNSITNTTESVTKQVNGKQVTLNVGDIKRIEYNNKVYRTRVLGFNHDTLANSELGYGSKAGISFEFLDCMGSHEMNPDSRYS